MVRYWFITTVPLLVSQSSAFQTVPSFGTGIKTCTALNAAGSAHNDDDNDSRRKFLTQSSTAVLAGLLSSAIPPVESAQATLYLDPAMYGDQENRVSAVDSCRESVRRAILQNPSLAPAFYTLALLDSLSFNLKTGDGGPDGRVVTALLATKETTPYISNLKEAANVLIAGKKSLNRLTAITIADSVAIGGAETIQAIGGPTLSVQVGRIDAEKNLKFDKAVPLDLFEGKRPASEIREFFQRSGLTDREMTALLSGLMTVNTVEKEKDPSTWKNSNKSKFVERGKMGRSSDYKKLSDEDIAKEFAKDYDDNDDGLQDEDWYIADSFGTKDQAFGKKTGELDVKTFNKYIKELSKYIQAKNSSEQRFGWIGTLLLDKDTPATQQWLAKYGTSYLNYQKDLGVAYNSMTQLGAEYTGGKYENLLKNKPRKTLNDD
mmetsp:Transcript_21168/g.25172  ORF Transcript_21168/g.25172 Transcript_21168/m.25172 type:complete len:433 (-) Transcript_21168:74-1372(-)